LRRNQKVNFIRPNIFFLSILIGITNDKIVILNFDDGRRTQFTHAKPILDKYGFKATHYIVCNYIEKKSGFMNWREVTQLYEEGHDIGSHIELFENEMKYLHDHNFRVITMRDLGYEENSDYLYIKSI
jgi:peptidoglycan/xylan/chitin deacetylase (PgdA/CDA1 family)